MRRIAIEFVNSGELKDQFDQHLKGGGLFLVDSYELGPDEVCELELVHPSSGELFLLQARVVWMPPAPARGVGLAIVGFDAPLRERIAQFVAGEGGQEGAIGTPSQIFSHGVGVEVFADGMTAEIPGVIEDAPVHSEQQPERCDEDLECLDVDELAKAEELVARSTGADLHERLRGLNAAEQIKIARNGELSERVLLERIYGKTVWEALLRNPRITVAEVGRIARMGNLSRPLVELIVGNQAWLASAQVRRALLSNPRLSSEGVQKVLRSMPRHELRLVPRQTTYSMQIRSAAKKLLGA